MRKTVWTERNVVDEDLSLNNVRLIITFEVLGTLLQRPENRISRSVFMPFNQSLGNTRVIIVVMIMSG